ncbi:MAG: NfeD family protein [Rivularia sp. (in: Bacteria)]|nr:NfeD family protein [Rivularia sp. MS3]
MISRLKSNKSSNLIQKIAKANGAIALAFFALILPACDANDTIGEVKPTEESTATNTGDTTTGGATANLPDDTDGRPASAGLPNAELIGETVTVSTKVKEIVGPKAFIVYDKESLRGQEMLVVSDKDAPPVGTNIEVTGVVGTFDAAVIKRDYDLDFTPDLVKVYENRPYLAAKAMEKVD